MPAGFYAVNPGSGTFVIDDTFRSLAMRQKGSVVLDADGHGTVIWNSATTPMLAIHTDGSFVRVMGGYNSGSTAAWTISGDPNTGHTYYIFDVPVGSSTFGLQIFNADGDLTFDSGLKYARYAGFVSDANASSAPAALTLPAGKTYAVVSVHTGWNSDMEYKTEGIPSPEGNTYYRTKFSGSGFATNSNVVSFNYAPFDDWSDWSDRPLPAEQVPTGNYTQMSMQALVLDVTGY